jgi:drug/metabolite transporter (DMT)-like permease
VQKKLIFQTPQMKQSRRGQNTRIGIFFAVAATVLWSGNFIVARGIIQEVSPIALSFFRWATATLILFPFAFRAVKADAALLTKHRFYLFFTALCGIAIFNTLVYVAGHYSPAINLALIGTTSAPVFSTVLAAIFLKEKIRAARLAGMLICFAGILLLLSKGSWAILRTFRFGTGDAWVLAGAFAFAVYTIQVRRKPKDLSNLSFLWTLFALGTLMLLPFYLWEAQRVAPINWTPGIFTVILYLGAGTSVAAFLIWNLAIGHLGAARTAIFGNLIPLFSTIEAVLILGEPVQSIHFSSGLLILAGLIIANKRNKENAPNSAQRIAEAEHER